MKPRVKLLIDSIWGDIVAFWTHPTWASFNGIFADVSLWFVMPFSAGYLRMEIYKVYNSDKSTYDNAEVSEAYMFKDAIQMFKQKYWSILGKNWY